MYSHEEIGSFLTGDFRTTLQLDIVVTVANHDRCVAWHSFKLIEQSARNLQRDVLFSQFAIKTDTTRIFAAVSG